MTDYVRVAGVYAITHLATGTSYVGASLDIGKRFKEQRNDLNRGRCNKRLRADWARDGETAFRMEILETGIDRTDLSAREQYWIDTLPQVYNARKSEPRPEWVCDGDVPLARSKRKPNVHRMDQETFGARVRRVRAARGMSQAELAEKSQLNVKHLSDLERDRYATRVRLGTVRRLASALQVDPVWLQFGIVETFPAPAVSECRPDDTIER